MAQLKGPVLMDNERMREEIKTLNARILIQQRDIAALKNISDSHHAMVIDSENRHADTRTRLAWMSAIAGTSVLLNVFLIALHRLT